MSITATNEKENLKRDSNLCSSSEVTGISSSTETERPDAIDIIGGYGPWQRIIFILLFLSSVPSTWHNLMMTFMAPPGIDYWCARPPELNVTVEKWRNLTSTPAGRNNCEIIQYYGNETLSETPIKCTAWEYNTTFYQSTIIDEWNLVCDREWLISLTKSVYNVGYLVAVLVFGQVSDSIGRRPTLLLSFIVNVLAGILSAFSTSYVMFVILRFFTAVGAAGYYAVSFVILVEIVSPKNRPTIGISINFGWCLAFMSLPAVAWVARDWFWLQIVVTLPKLLFVPIFWMVPESPRWLLIHKKHDEFKRVVTKAAVKNGRPEDIVRAEINKLLISTEKDVTSKKNEKVATVFDLMKTPELRKNTLNLYYNWLVNSFIYFALSYNTDDLAGNVYLNFFISGAVEFPAYICAIYVIKKMGRRLPLSTAMVTAGIACALTITVPSGRLQWLNVTFSMLGKFFITATFAIVYIYSAEIFPTVVRNVGVGTGSTFARVGSTIAPFVKELGVVSSPLVPNILFAALSISSGLLVLLLPETNNIRFTDTLEEAENFGRNSRKDTSKQKANVI